MIRTGIGGWVYPAWRETFYPPEVKPAQALAYAASKLSAIEINATFYRTQSEASFAHWAEQVPDGFVFAVKAARGAAQRREAEEAAPAIARFLGSGLVALGPKLGPILWQLPAGRRFEPEMFARFLDLLPAELEGLRLRHVIEAVHPSFQEPAALALLRERNIALALLDKPGVVPAIEPTADFTYLRLQGTVAEQQEGYDAAALDGWAKRLRELGAADRDVFAFVIAGAKERAPAAAMALARRLLLRERPPAP